jgi:hypothetical protein
LASLVPVIPENIDFKLGTIFFMEDLHSLSNMNRMMITANYLIYFFTFIMKPMMERVSTNVEVPDEPLF